MRRSATEWAVRGGIAIAVGVLGWASVAQTLGYAIRASDPARAHGLAPRDGRVTALLAQHLLGTDPTTADRLRVERLARLALRQDATAVTAAATLGVTDQLGGNIAAARRLFVYAETLSRRDLQTQLWAVQDAVDRGDVPGALRHYDIALRTSANAPGLLFPVLAAAISGTPVRSALVRTMASKPQWAGSFIGYLAEAGQDRRATANLFMGLSRAGVPVSEEAQAQAVAGLISGGFLDAAWAYYASIRPAVDRHRSRDARFAADLSAPSPLDWTAVSDAGITSSIQRSDRGGLVDFAAARSIGGPMLQQVQLLPPGNYRLVGHSIGVDQAEPALPYWVLTCRDGPELGRVTVPASARANGMFAGRFSVPAGCPVQTLALVASPSDAITGLTGQIDQVRLVPQS